MSFISIARVRLGSKSPFRSSVTEIRTSSIIYSEYGIWKLRPKSCLQPCIHWKIASVDWCCEMLAISCLEVEWTSYRAEVPTWKINIGVARQTLLCIIDHKMRYTNSIWLAMAINYGVVWPPQIFYCRDKVTLTPRSCLLWYRDNTYPIWDGFPHRVRRSPKKTIWSKPSFQRYGSEMACGDYCGTGLHLLTANSAKDSLCLNPRFDSQSQPRIYHHRPSTAALTNAHPSALMLQGKGDV